MFYIRDMNKDFTHFLIMKTRRTYNYKYRKIYRMNGEGLIVSLICPVHIPFHL